ncbi:hypothetical protein BFG60_1339 [Microcystis aeruginosa NIES-98]|nr:hypothetical protein BFG60_1339 [Microcystis aeruginosa NIES-98]
MIKSSRIGLLVILSQIYLSMACPQSCLKGIEEWEVGRRERI